MSAKRGAIVLVSLVIGALVLASCSSPSTTPSGSSTAETKPYGSVTLTAFFHPAGIDPQNASPGGYRALSASFLDSLIHFSPNKELIPGIAERWEIAPDGLSQTFYIRKGVKFHDGSDLTGADVKFSIERWVVPQALNTDSVLLRELLDRVVLKDDYTVVIYLKQPQWEVARSFNDFSGGASVVMPKKYIEEKGIDYWLKNPIGSGPFKVLKWEPGIRLELEANENYWGAAPKFKNISVVNILDDATKVAMLKTGELDLGQVPIDSMNSLKQAGLRVVGFDSGGSYYTSYLYDMEHPEKHPIGDLRVRKALSLALNRQEIVSSLFSGFAEPAALVYARPTPLFSYPDVVKPDPFDAEGAKKLLAEAGQANGFTLKVYDPDPGGIGSNLVLAEAGYWRKVGVNAQIVPIGWASLRPMFIPKHVPDVWSSAYTWTTPSPVGFERMVTMYHSVKGSNKNSNDLKLDELIDKAPLTKDPAEKKKMMLEAAVLAKDGYSIVGVVNPLSPIAYGSKIGEFTPIKGLEGLAVTFQTLTHGK